jgi:hypothetical protein
MPHVPVRLSSWVLVIGAALAGLAAVVSAYTDAGGPGATYLSGLSGVLAIALGVLRSWQANTLAWTQPAADEIPAEAGDPNDEQ